MDAHVDFSFSGKRIHLGVCGSVSAYRALDVVRAWQNAGINVSVTLTPSAQRFVTALSFEALGASVVYTSMFDDTTAPSVFGHLEPGQTSHAMMIAPLSAASLARLAHGHADELLACQALAHTGPLVLAPAMNPAMWAHPATQANIDILRRRGGIVVGPDWGTTACGDQGQGRLASVPQLVLAGFRTVCEQDMAGQHVLVTVGPTREAWDDVRFWSNPSTGTMGAALATAAWLRGAHVHVLAGPGVPWLIEDERLVRRNVTSAAEMFDAAMALWPACTMGVFTAAVADFSPVPHTAGKFKKADAGMLNIEFVQNPDILRTLAQMARAQESHRNAQPKIMGFAAESSALEQAVHTKLLSKQADMIVGNYIADGFASTKNTVFIEDKNGRTEHLNNMPKATLAWELLTWLLSL